MAYKNKPYEDDISAEVEAVITDLFQDLQVTDADRYIELLDMYDMELNMLANAY
jgi:hypothetical protein